MFGDGQFQPREPRSHGIYRGAAVIQANLPSGDAVYAFTIPHILLKDGYNHVNVRSTQPSPFFMKRMEVAVNYGDVHNFGNF